MPTIGEERDEPACPARVLCRYGLVLVDLFQLQACVDGPHREAPSGVPVASNRQASVIQRPGARLELRNQRRFVMGQAPDNRGRSLAGLCVCHPRVSLLPIARESGEMRYAVQLSDIQRRLRQPVGMRAEKRGG